MGSPDVVTYPQPHGSSVAIGMVIGRHPANPREFFRRRSLRRSGSGERESCLCGVHGKESTSKEKDKTEGVGD